MLRRSKKGKTPGEPGRILLTAESVESAILVERVLAQAGHEVTRAPLSSDSLSRLMGTDGYDAVVIDTGGSSSADGLKLLDQIRSVDDADLASIPVIMLGGNERTRIFSWQSGVDGFLVRPVHADAIRSEVALVLARDERERAAHRQSELARLSG